MILPGGEVEVVYRDDYHGYASALFCCRSHFADSVQRPPEKYGPELQGFGFHHKVYSCLGGLPQIVVPGEGPSVVSRVYLLTHALVGQHQILSKNTHDLIWEPISVIIVGPAGEVLL